MKVFLHAMLLFTMLASGAAAAESREWSFRVLLDDQEVGSQYFRLQETAGKLRLETEADLAVKMLFVTVYRYRHRNIETWENGCLTEIQANTRVNGKDLNVTGEQKDGVFAVIAKDHSSRLPGCVMSFAYWNPSFLKETQLLNSQSGEYVSVEVSGPVFDERMVRGERVPAQRYRLIAGEIDMKIWYSLDNSWLALESKTRNGKTLTYDLM